VPKEQPVKPYVLQYYDQGWGGWRDMPYDTLVSDDAASFDSIEEGRVLAQDVARRQPYKTRVKRQSDGVVVAEYRRGGATVL